MVSEFAARDDVLRSDRIIYDHRSVLGNISKGVYLRKAWECFYGSPLGDYTYAVLPVGYVQDTCVYMMIGRSQKKCDTVIAQCI